MINSLLGSIQGGRLKRLPYLGYSLLIGLLMIAFVFVVVLVNTSLVNGRSRVISQ